MAKSRKERKQALRAARKAKTPKEDPKPTRRISDTMLMRVLDPHMLESLSDIAAVYQKLMGSLGYGSQKFSDKPRVDTSVTFKETALEHAEIIATWQKECIKRKLRPQSVLLIITDGHNLVSLMRQLRLKLHCVKAQLRACLTVWSVHRKRCNISELQIQLKQKRACC
jgi:hypothetical protein